MKTFDEAVEIIIPIVDNKTIKDINKIKEIESRLVLLITAYQSEAMENKTVQHFLFSMCIEVAEEKIHPLDSELTIFLTGLAIGREMEKQEQEMPAL